MSASTIQFTFVPPIPVISASSASCWLRFGPESIGEPEEFLLVNLVQYGGGRSLDDFVLKRRYGERALPSIGLRYVPTPGRLRPVRSPMNSGMQVREPALEISLVCPAISRHPRLLPHLA